MSLTLETLRADHADLVAQIETAARAGMVTQADHESALTAARTEAASTARTGILALHGAVYGEEFGKKFTAIVESGINAEQAKALGVQAATGDESSRAAILQALQSSASDGLKPAQVQSAQKASIDTGAIYASRQGK